MTKLKELEKEVQELQKQLDAVQGRQQHTAKTHYLHWIEQPAEVKALEALTAAEADFLKKYGIDEAERNLSFDINMQHFTLEQLSGIKSTIEALQKKRCVRVNWHS